MSGKTFVERMSDLKAESQRYQELCRRLSLETKRGKNGVWLWITGKVEPPMTIVDDIVRVVSDFLGEPLERSDLFPKTAQRERMRQERRRMRND